MRLILVCLLMLLPSVQEPQPKPKNKTLHMPGVFWNEYDRFTDTTTVMVGLFTLEDMSARLSSKGVVKLGAAFFYDGQILTAKPTEYGLLFSSNSKEWEFLKRNRLYILADGERFAFAPQAQDREVKIGRIEHLLAFTLPAKTFEKLAQAKKIEIRLGDYEAELTDLHLAAFRELVEAGTPTPALQ